MPFDKPTRNLLAKMVTQCRDRLAEDIADQLQSSYGLYPDGTALDVAKTEGDRRAAEDLLALWDHFEAAEASSTKARRAIAYQRLVREIGFTLLNRLAALRLCEERGLLVECVRRGMASDGFQLFDRIAGGALGNRYQTYRAFLESLFDELALDLGVLFDRSTPQSLVFPSEAALTEVLAWLNDPKLAAYGVWQQDETIGWIYQYYNDPKERKAMRDASTAPRNSRELAVRNQFFTPRYVVEFLTDNTLGRLWYEMCQGDTRLAEQCRYLVRRPNEVFLQQGEDPPQDQEKPSGLSQEELLEQPVHIPYRPTKDPRDLKILDPACGSGHFLLYSFDLLTVIYEEAWTDPYLPPFSETGTKLADDYPDLGTVRRDIPGLVLRHNLHGIDIDPRAVQIAALALWLRAQRAYQELGLPPAERPRITKTNLVTAEPMPGDRELLDEFVRDLRPRVLGDLVWVVFEKMELAGEAGSLLKIEEELADAIAEAYRQWVREPKAEQLALFPEDRRPKPEQLPLFDISGISDEAFWETSEARVLQALHDYAAQVENGEGTRRRLFANDAAQGFAFVDLCRKRFDVALMNPPFGAIVRTTATYCSTEYPDSSHDIAYAFVERALRLLSVSGLVGCISTRTGFFIPTSEKWRSNVTDNGRRMVVCADLGYGVLDAVVETAAYVISSNKADPIGIFLNLLEAVEKGSALYNLATVPNDNYHIVDVQGFKGLPGTPFGYWAPTSLLSSFATCQTFEPNWGVVKRGVATGDNERFLRLLWEVSPRTIGPKLNWIWYVSGGEYSPYHVEVHLLLEWSSDGYSLKNFTDERGRLRSRPQNLDFFFKPGLNYSTRTTSGFAARVLPGQSGFDQSANPIILNENSNIDPMAALSLLLTRPVLAFVELSVGSGDTSQSGTAARNYTNGLVGRIPVPLLGEEALSRLSTIGSRIVELKRKSSVVSETASEFVCPRHIIHRGNSVESSLSLCVRDDMARIVEILRLSYEADKVSVGAYSVDKDGQRFLDSFIGPHPSSYATTEVSLYAKDTSPARVTTKKCYWADRELEVRSHEVHKDPANIAQDANFIRERVAQELENECHSMLSYLLGCVTGRWDVRIALAPSIAPRLQESLDPLPACSPGMLVGPDGLPAKSGDIVSEAWLRARPDAITLPPEGSFDGPATIPDDAYPIRIAWDGILVDDPGLGEHPEPHPSDVVRCVREVLAVLWPENHDAIEAEACEILGVRELRDYFRKPTKFFADHLKRYSKSRRKAPIYWPLSTSSGSYTLWLYYHRLDDQTLYTAVNRYVTPKIERVEGYVARLEADLAQVTGRAASNLRDQLDQVQGFLAELREFREELLRIAGLPYKPNLNDGVIINAAPLHRLFGLRKWAKDTEAVWRKLEKGEYDWAHMAYTLWPERVQEVCKHDRSIAIAHGLEELCEVPEKGAKKQGKRQKKRGQESQAELP
jgi:hypothetical protein